MVPESQGAAGAVRAGGLRLGSARYSSVGLLVALILLFIVTPVVEDAPHGPVVEAVLLTLVLLSSVGAVGGRRRTLVLAIVLVTPVVAGKWLHHFRPDLVHPAVYLGAGMVFIAFVVMNLLWFALCSSRVTFEPLWALAYVLVAGVSPGAFSFSPGPDANRSMDGFDAFYFSFGILTTVGFGDISPVSKAARMLAVMEAITGTFYVAVLIARLVATHAVTGRSEDVHGL